MCRLNHRFSVPLLLCRTIKRELLAPGERHGTLGNIARHAGHGVSPWGHSLVGSIQLSGVVKAVDFLFPLVKSYKSREEKDLVIMKGSLRVSYCTNSPVVGMSINYHLLTIIRVGRKYVMIKSIFYPTIQAQFGGCHLEISTKFMPVI